ncbi:MAG: transposase, partial [Verrucomicrobiales bacterium]|nr:transposase [Verrucomicrobiales bacterium]
KDYANGNVQKTMALDAVEFIRRFLQHVVPTGFVRIRHFGFLAHRFRKAKLQLCRNLLAQAKTPAPEVLAAPPAPVECRPTPAEESTADRHRCPHCGHGHMIILERFERGSLPAGVAVAIGISEDTS